MIILQNLAETPLLPRDLYNMNAQAHRALQNGQASTATLIERYKEQGIYHQVLLDNSNRVQALFVIFLGSMDYLRANYNVLLLDYTYKTNKFNMPLLNCVGKLDFSINI